MSLQVTQSIKDIIPTCPDPIPPQLISHIDSLYKISLQKIPNLPNKSEIARYHICTYFAIEKLQNKLDLPGPLKDKIPVSPRHLNRVLDDFRENVLGMARESLTPVGTPKKNRQQQHLAGPGTPSRNTPKVSSPLKKLQQLKEDLQTPQKKMKIEFKDIESPFNPTPKTVNRAESPSVNSSPLKSKRLVTIPELIAFANHFFIPASVTPNIIVSYSNLRSKFAKKNEWLLACGMIHTVYMRINHQIMNKKIGSKAQFEDQIFQYQKGGLMKWNVLVWCTIVADMLKNEIWLIELERNYSSNRLHYVNLMQQEKEERCKFGIEVNLRRFGAMIDPSVKFTSTLQQEYYDVWTEKVKDRISKEEAGRTNKRTIEEANR